VIHLSDVVEKGFHPLALRYFFLQAHYRTPLSFSWSALAGASAALERLWKMSRDIAEESKKKSEPSEARNHFAIALHDDLATPQALGILWESLHSEEYSPEEKWGLILDADAYLGLSLSDPVVATALKTEDIPTAIQDLLTKREAARTTKDFKEADRLRGEIEKSGYRVDDGASGPVLIKNSI
jgi:cysteinyl-tRNA synthetase